MPEDLETVYLVRRRLRETTEAIGMLYNMAEIIDKFGGSSATLDQMMAELREERERGLTAYFQADLDEALGAFANALQKSEDTMNEAIRVRNSAAFWIFFTEWCVVTGTSLFTGAVLWMLMVRRRLYREVRITKLRQVDE
jgi:hypothetical protein